MKRFSWKKMMSLVVALALVVGVLHFGTKVSAETEADAAATAALTNGNIQFTVDREFLKTGGNQVHSDVIIVIDCSVSMGNRVPNTNPSQTRLQVAKAQAQAFKDELDKDANVTVVGIFGFGGYAQEVEKISDISSISGTNVDDALEKAQAKFDAMTTVSNPTIVILTDGEANRANKHEGETGNATALTVAQINNALNDDNIKIYAIDFGDSGTIFTNDGINNTNGNLTNSSTSTFSSTELAAAFKNITTAIQTYTVDNAKIVAKLTDFVNYVGPVNDDIEYDKNTIIWHIDDGDITDVNYKEVKSPEFAFKLVDPNSPQAEGETDADYQARVARALINYAKGGTKVDGVVTSTDGIVKYEPLADGKVKITVKITADNDTKLYFNINGAAQTPKNVNNLDTLTAIFTPDMPQDTWTIAYTLDGSPILGEDGEALVETVYVNCDDTLTEDEVEAKYLLSAYEPDADGNCAFTRNITVDGKEYTVSYTHKPVMWTVVVKAGEATIYTYEDIQRAWNNGLSEQEVYVDYVVDKNVETYNTEERQLSADDFEATPSVVLTGDAEWTITYIPKEITTENWIVKYVVGTYSYVDDNTYAERDVLNPVTADEVSKNRIAVSALPDGGFAEADYELDSVVKTGDFEFTVTYVEKKVPPVAEPVKVTIYYVYENGTTAAAAKVESGIPGTSYSVTSPVINGYTANRSVVSGTIPKENTEITVTYTKNQSIIIPPIIRPTEEPTPTPEPTPIPTAVPTEEPTPTPEPEVDIEEPETPEGDVEIDEIETPEGAPEEEVDVEPIDTPQGDLPQTGVAPAVVFYGIGAACVLIGSVLVIRRRKEQE